MTLAIAIKVPDGLTLAAESRVTLNRGIGNNIATAHFDTASKPFSYEAQSHIGVVTSGLAAIGFAPQRTAQSYMPEFEATLPARRISVADFTERLYHFFTAEWEKTMPTDWKGSKIYFVVAGFDEPTSAHGKIYQIAIPSKISSFDLCEEHVNGFGISFRGVNHIVDRILYGYDLNLPDYVARALGLDEDKKRALSEALITLAMPFPFECASLQESIDLATFFIQATIRYQQLSVMERTCGGPIDIACITRTGGLIFIKRKEIAGRYLEIA